MVRCDIKVYTHNHFFCRWQPGSWLPSFASPKEGNPRKVDPGLPRLRRTLGCLQTNGAAQLALVGRKRHTQLRSSNSARLTTPLFAINLRRRTGVKGDTERTHVFPAEFHIEQQS